VAAVSCALLAPAVARSDAEKPKRKEPQEQAAADRAGKPAGPARAKAYTDDDLKKYADERAARGESASSSDDTPLVEERPEPPDAESGESRQVWADRARAQRERIAAAQATLAEIEERIAALRNDREPTRVMEPFRLQAIEGEIRKATEELEAAKKELAEARAALEAVEQDARRRGVPAGWLREP
jgi:hypothetical protein